jgi:Histone H1-like protein Hc1
MVFSEGRLMEAFQRMKTLISMIEDDMAKAAGGNKAAGTRVRQAMQDIKAAAQDIREKILELRGSDEAPDGKDTKPGKNA